MFGMCIIIGSFISNKLISIITQVVIGSITYGIVLIILRDKFVSEIIYKVREKLKIRLKQS